MTKLKDSRLERKAQLIANQAFTGYMLSEGSKESVEENEQKLKMFLNQARELVSKYIK